MSKKYHIGKNGVPSICKASIRNCPYGGSDLHFDSFEKAQIYADAVNTAIKELEDTDQWVIDVKQINNSLGIDNIIVQDPSKYSNLDIDFEDVLGDCKYINVNLESNSEANAVIKRFYKEIGLDAKPGTLDLIYSLDVPILAKEAAGEFFDRKLDKINSNNNSDVLKYFKTYRPHLLDKILEKYDRHYTIATGWNYETDSPIERPYELSDEQVVGRFLSDNDHYKLDNDKLRMEDFYETNNAPTFTYKNKKYVLINNI